MTNYILLAVCIVAVGAQSLFRKQFSLDSDDTISPYVFHFLAGAASVVFMFAVILISGSGLTFHLPTLILAVSFGVSFIIATTTILYAIKYGSLSLTSLLLSYSIILPALFGIVVFGEAIRIPTIIGLILLVISLYMFNKKNETLVINKKWLFYVTLLFISNGTCAILQKVHQTWYPGQYQNDFLLIGMSVVTVINLLFLVFLPKKGIGRAFKCGSYLAVPNGLCNVFANFLIMLLTVALPSAVLFPVVSAGGIVTAFLISKFIYKEKMSKLQIAGFAVSLVSITVLNL